MTILNIILVLMISNPTQFGGSMKTITTVPVVSMASCHMLAEQWRKQGRIYEAVCLQSDTK